MLDVWECFDRSDDKESIRRDRFGFGMIIYGRVDVNITQNNVILFSNLLDKIAI